MSDTTSQLHSARVFDEFSPKTIILQTRSAFRYVLSQWKWILVIGIVFGIAAAIYSYFKKPVYAAEITFAIDENSGPPAASPAINVDALLNTSLDAGTVFSSLTNIVELMQSRLLIEKTLRSAVTIDGKSLLFADFFLDSLGYRDKWMQGPYLHLDFRKVKTDKKEYLFESSIMRSIYETLVAENIKVNPKGKGTTIISVTCISEHELFSKYFLEAWLNEVARYYVETKTQRAKTFLNFIQKRTDSVRLAYNSALYGRASYADAHANSIRQTVSVSVERQQTDVQLLRNSYVELVRSLEAAKTTLMHDTPLIQFLDTPILPLKLEKPSLVKRFILFFIVGSVLTAGFLVVNRAYKNIIHS